MPARQGVIRLFHFRGIQVFLHWSWFLVAAYEIGERTRSYSFIGWNVVEYVALFGIVLLHEFGHAFACRSVGGRADEILLWPLGGVAYVDPPPRAGAVLWSIAAGPLVNVALLPVLAGFTLLTRGGSPDLHAFWRTLTFIDAGLLFFNVLPVYPLDGGQILRALLWFVIGRARSLMVTAVLGFAGVAGLVWLAISTGSLWLGLVAFYVLQRCVRGFQQAQALRQIDGMVRRDEYRCRACGAHPPIGPFWNCAACGQDVDAFDAPPACPVCREELPGPRCPLCGAAAPWAEWEPGEAAAVSSANAEGAWGRGPSRPPAVPSILPAVGGVAVALLAIPPLLVAVLTAKVARDQVARQPEYREEFDRLWNFGGIPAPGDGAMLLQRGRFYVAYLETSRRDARLRVPLALTVTNAASGETLAVDELDPPRTAQFLARGDRELTPRVMFWVAESGEYLVRAEVAQPLGAARVKFGPSPAEVAGDGWRFSRAIAIASALAALALLLLASWLLVFYGRRRRAFNRAMRQFADTSPIGHRA